MVVRAVTKKEKGMFGRKWPQISPRQKVNSCSSCMWFQASAAK